MKFYPAPIGTATFPYISNAWARAADGTARAWFEADTDAFTIDERLLTLGLIWRWKAQKGMEYGEDMATYEQALSQAQARDAGSRVYRNRRPVFGGAQVAYTGTALQ